MSSILFNRIPGLVRPIAVAALLAGLAGCGEAPQQPASAPREVQVALAVATNTTNIARLTGDLQAANEAELGFRIGGKVIERLVDVGDNVVAGQVLARLDSQNENNALQAAKAIRLAARGEVEQMRETFNRQSRLMQQGFTTRRLYDQAVTGMEVAKARLEEAEAQVSIAMDRIGFTELRADAAGIVTTRALEAGEVVQAGQVVIRLARDGGRDAVFNVSPRFLDQQPASGLFRISLATDTQISVMGRIREIAPQADPVTGTFRIRVGLDKLPAGMQLGSTIVGTLEKSSTLVVSIPASALMVMGGEPAVWVVDPATSRVALRRIEVIQYDYATVTVAQGLEAGEMVVSGGIQALHPGQHVKILPPATGARSASLSRKTAAAKACLGNACDMRRRLTANGIFNSARGIDG